MLFMVLTSLITIEHMFSWEYLNDLNLQMSYKMELSHPKVKREVPGL